MNPYYLCVVNTLVDNLEAAGALKIAVLTPYKGQLRLHQKLHGPKQTPEVLSTHKKHAHEVHKEHSRQSVERSTHRRRIGT